MPDLSSVGAYEFTVHDVKSVEDGDDSVISRLYVPRGKDLQPALIHVHGGHWIHGDHTSGSYLCEGLARLGIAVMTPGFRQPPACKYPESIADVHASIRWLKAHGREFGIDPAAIGGISTSSGGHALSLIAMRPTDPRYARIVSPTVRDLDARLRFVIMYYPVVDPLGRYRMALQAGLVSKLEGHHAYFASEDEMAEGNPLLILERGEPAELPPVLYLHAQNDSAVPADMADRYVAAYKLRGGEIDFIRYLDTPHGFMSPAKHCDATADSLLRVRQFVEIQTGVGRD